MDQLERFGSNYEIAYELGVLDALSLAYKKKTEHQGADAPLVIPASLTKAVSARYMTPHNDLVRAATLSQRAIEETTNTTGSLTDFIVVQVYDTEYKMWYRWMPSATAVITGRSVQACAPCYSTDIAANTAASSFMRELAMKVCQFATAREKKLIQNTVAERYRQIAYQCKAGIVDSHCIVMGLKGMFLVAVSQYTNSPDFIAAVYLATIKACVLCQSVDRTIVVKYVGHHQGPMGRIIYTAVACNVNVKPMFQRHLDAQLAYLNLS